MSSGSIYLDYNGTTPISPDVVEKISQSLSADWGNPSSSHFRGVQAKEKVDTARQQLSQSINAQPDNIVFTSGGTESLNWIIYSICRSNPSSPPHVVTTKIEHCAVINPLKRVETEGVTVDYIAPLDGAFHVNSDRICSSISAKTRLVAVMMANNETGAIQPVEAIGSAIEQINHDRSPELVITASD